MEYYSKIFFNNLFNYCNGPGLELSRFTFHSFLRMRIIIMTIFTKSAERKV